MLEQIFGTHAPMVKQAFEFIVGKPHKAMGFAYMLVIMNIVVTIFRKRAFLTTVREGVEKMVAYTAFIIMGNILDSLMVDQMFGWKGSTQFLICLYIVSREIKELKDYLTQKYGIDIPILNERLGKLEGTVAPPQETQQDLTTRITKLQTELQELERLKQEESVAKPTENPPVG